MKRNIVLSEWVVRWVLNTVGLVLLAFFCSRVQAQTSPVPTAGGAAVDGWQAVAQSLEAAERGEHFQNWNRVTTLRDNKGNTVLQTNLAYVELQTGMNYRDGETWVAAQETIEAYPTGAIARQGGHKVIFGDNLLYSAVLIDMETPDGKRLQSRIIGLGYFDSASGKSVLFAEVKDCQGQILGSNQVLYADAFTGCMADVRYTYTKAGLEQDVILRAGPPKPESFGLDTKTTRLQVLTEFFAPPPPAIEMTKLAAEAGGLEDQALDFGAMQMHQGKTFLLGLDPAAAVETAVAKRWVDIGGRTILFEEVSMARLAEQLKTLPAPKRTAFLWRKPARQVAAMRPHLPARRTGKSAPRAMQLAKLSPPPRGVVLDYTLLASAANVTLQADTTYYVSGLVNLSGTTGIEGGTVVKFDNSSSAKISVAGAGLVCKTGPYRPAVFTSKFDSSVGETVATGTPVNTGATYLEVSAGGTNALKYLRFLYAGTALSQIYAPRPIWHSQFLLSTYAIKDNPMASSGTQELHNVLLAQCAVGINGVSGTVSVQGEQVTADQITQFWIGPGTPANALTNSILHSVANLGASFNLDSCYQGADPGLFLNDPNLPAAKYYLADASYREIGNPNINPALLADLKLKTTYPPTVRTANFTTDTILVPDVSVPRDIGPAPDCGYHYDALDYCWTGLNLNNATLTLGNGVAIGFYGQYGTILQTGAKIISQGSPQNHIQLARYSSVQEQPFVWGTTGTSMAMFQGGCDFARFNFTDVSFLAASNAKRQFVFLNSATGANQWSMKDCQLRAAYVSLFDLAYLKPSMGFTNNLFERCQLALSQYSNPLGPISLVNNLLVGGATSISISTQTWNWTVANNLFDAVTLTRSGVNSWNACNAYYQTTALPATPGPSYPLTAVDFQSSGPLGGYYYPTTGGNLSSLIDHGNMSAAAAGLSSYTIRTDQTPDSGTVDIGFHYHHTGQVKWTWSNASYCFNPIISSSPAIGNNGIIYFTDDCDLYAINPATHDLWTDWSNNGYGGVFPLNNAIGNELVASPMLGTDGTTIYVGSSDSSLYATLYAVRSATGSQKWFFSSGIEFYFSSAALATAGTIYVGNANSYTPNYYAVTDSVSQGILTPSFNSGSPKTLGSSFAEIDASAVIGTNGSTSYIATEEGDPFAGDPRIYALNAAGVILWDYPLLSGEVHRSPSVGSDGTVYLGDSDGTLYAFYPGLHTPQTKWTYQTPLAEYITTTPIIGPDGTVYFGSAKNVLYAVTNGVLKWSYSFGSTTKSILATPALAADGTIYVSSTDGNLYAMLTDSSAPYSGPLWQVQVPAPYSGRMEKLTSSPAIGTDGMVYICGSDGNLYAIQGLAGPPNSAWPLWRKNNAHQANAALP